MPKPSVDAKPHSRSGSRGGAQQAGRAARGRWRAKVEGRQAGWPRSRIRERGVLANKPAASNGIYGGADVLQLGQMAGGCGENVIS